MAHLAIGKFGVINFLRRPFFGNVAIRTWSGIVLSGRVVLMAIHAIRKVFMAKCNFVPILGVMAIRTLFVVVVVFAVTISAIS